MNFTFDASRRASLGRAAALCAGAAWPAVRLQAAGARSATAPEIVLLRDAPADLDPAGYLVSEKFDGVRAVWDGRGLRFRSGQPIAAPAWFLAALPSSPLDGELWLGRGRFEQTVGIVRTADGMHPGWRELRYLVFELPGGDGSFATRHARLRELAAGAPAGPWQAVEQGPIADRAALQRRLDAVVQGGGEGLVLHRADARYQTGRSSAVLKLKPIQDADGRVRGYLPGRGKYAGQVGALALRTDDGVSFALGSGLSDAMRATPPAIGTRVTFTYQGTTAAGVPRFARFLRVHPADV